MGQGASAVQGRFRYEESREEMIAEGFAELEEENILANRGTGSHRSAAPVEVLTSRRS